MQRTERGAARRLIAGLLAAAAGCTPTGERTTQHRATDEAPPQDGVWRAGPQLPQPVSNNAVAAVTVDGRTSVFTFAGIDSTKAWSGVTNVAYRWNVGSDAWHPIEPVPGQGRLAATAQGVDGLVYVFGGYTVAEDGSERSLPDVAIHDPRSGTWTRGADIPVPTDDAVSGVWRGDRVILVSGWHDAGNITDVQVYDPAADAWTAVTPIAGTPVFGHAGGVADGQIVYTGGAAVVDATPRFVVDSASWVGTLTPDPELDVAWRRPSRRPGPPLYRAAGGVAGSLVVFLGGTDNPYNYTGVGYDGVPAEPLHQLLGYAPGADAWGHLEPPPEATMDHRNLASSGGRVFLVGGMVRGRSVSDHVWWANTADLVATFRAVDRGDS